MISLRPGLRAGVRISVFFLLLLLLSGLRPLDAQEPPPPDTLQQQMEALKARLDSLEALIERLRATPAQEAPAPEAEEDPIAALRAAAQAAAAEADTARPAPRQEETTAFVGRQRALQALNPEISAGGDIFAHMNPDDPSQNNFFPRELELAFVASLDPFSRGKVFLSRGVEGGEIVPFQADAEVPGRQESSVDVEEAYVEWVNLPGGLGLTLGKFNQRLGTLNRWHDHALPFQNRPLPHLAFVGGEPLSQTGASLYFLVPGITWGTWQGWFQVTRSDTPELFGESVKPSYLGHLNGFWDLSPSLDLDLGFSAVFGPYETTETAYDQSLYSVEGTLTWRPPGRSLYRGAVLRGGVLVKDPRDAGFEGTPERAVGAWAMGELRLSERWLAGAQFGWVEDPNDPEETAWLTGPALTWWQSEFVRVRAEYDILHDLGETESQLVLQITFAMGPHKHEAY
jgi:hypothetical protein